MLGAKNPDPIWGYDGNDTIQGGNGNDTINGGAGTDTGVYLGNKVNYIISKISAGYTVTDNIRESLFLRKIFPGFLLEKSAKNYATANAFGSPDSSSSPRLDPTRGRNIGSK